jgi:hypothetical protein
MAPTAFADNMVLIEGTDEQTPKGIAIPSV